MAKIKNWDKIIDDSHRIRYKHSTKRGVWVEVTKPFMGRNTIWEVTFTRPHPEAVNINDSFSEIRNYHGKQKALAAAREYMRRNP